MKNSITAIEIASYCQTLAPVFPIAVYRLKFLKIKIRPLPMTERKE